MSTLLDWLVENEPSFRKTRLPSLYSDLSVQKTTNPEGFAANVTAWQAALTSAALAGKLPSHQKLLLEVSDEILEVLSSPQYGKPSGIGLVLDECVRTGKLLEKGDFLKAEDSIYHRSRIPSLSAIVKWGLRQTRLTGNGSYNISGRLRNGDLVIVQALEEFSQQICAARATRSQSLTDRVTTRDNFREEIAKTCKTTFSPTEENILLKYMSRDKEVLSYDDHTVKFNTTSSDTTKLLTKEDATIASIKSLISKLESNIAELEKRSRELHAKAVVAVRNKNSQSGMSALKQKKAVEIVLQQRLDTMHQLQNVLTQIERASDQVQIIEVMQASASVLKDLNKRIGGVDKVEGIMDDMREEMAKADEVGQVLQETLDTGTAVDELDVDDELQAMERNEKEAQERRDSAATRVRLEELDSFEKQRLANDQALKSSIEQLENLDISGENRGKEKDKKVAEQIPS